MSARPWYRFENAASDPTVVDIQIVDFIGGWIDDAINRWYNESIGITARAFVEELAKLPSAVATLRVHINSPGGDVQGGINIANALRDQQMSKGRTVETYVDGLAASIASVIAMAGSKVVMADNALMMIHDPWSIEVGSAAEMRKTADVLDAMRDQIVATYQWHTKEDPKDIAALMAAETWMTADEALAKGFVTDITKGLAAAASVTRAAVNALKVPEQYRERVSAWVRPVEAVVPHARPEPPTPADPPAAALDVLRLCREADCSDLAEGLIADRISLGQVETKVASAKATRVAAKQRETDIRAACALAKMPARADFYIAEGVSVEAAKKDLTTITAMVDKVEIDGGLMPDHGAQAQGTKPWAQIFARQQKRA